MCNYLEIAKFNLLSEGFHMLCLQIRIKVNSTNMNYFTAKKWRGGKASHMRSACNSLLQTCPKKFIVIYKHADKFTSIHKGATILHHHQHSICSSLKSQTLKECKAAFTMYIHRSKTIYIHSEGERDLQYKCFLHASQR